MHKLVYTTKSGGLQRNKTSRLYDTTPAKILKYVRKHPLNKPESSATKPELRKDNKVSSSLSGQSHQFFASSSNINHINRVSCCHSSKSDDANKSFENNLEINSRKKEEDCDLVCKTTHRLSNISSNKQRGEKDTGAHPKSIPKQLKK